MRHHEPIDGFGQTLWDDIRFILGFWRCRRRNVLWRKPSAAEQQMFDAHLIIGRFGDLTEFVAEVDNRRWLVRERLWWGWPDAPRYAFFVLDGERIVVATDFNVWPSPWRPHPDQFEANHAHADPSENQ